MNHTPTPSPVRHLMLPYRVLSRPLPPEVMPVQEPASERMVIQARPDASKVILAIARSRDLKITAVVDVLLRAWTSLTPEQQERAFIPPSKESER